jgi:hypothetical protein
MATKLQAAQTIEGNFSEEGLKAMSQNDDMLTQIANNVVDGIKQVVNLDAFKSTQYVKEKSNITRNHKKTINQIELNMNEDGKRVVFNNNMNFSNNSFFINSLDNNQLKLLINS